VRRKGEFFAPARLMNKGEFLTRLTIWITLAGYFVGVTLYSLPPQGEKRDRAARIAWTVACLSLLAHFACAFHFYHHWSHDTAYRVTARQTAELFGLDWGGGLYLNYALLVGWVADVVWWWRDSRHTGTDSERWGSLAGISTLHVLQRHRRL
jgi:hypothetical protein